MGGGAVWVIRGTDLPVTDNRFGNLSRGVNTGANTIPVTVINNVTGAAKVIQLTLPHNGEFHFTLTLLLNAGKGNAGLWANLYLQPADKGAGIPRERHGQNHVRPRRGCYARCAGASAYGALRHAHGGRSARRCVRLK